MQQLFQHIADKAQDDPFALAIISPDVSINYLKLYLLIQSGVEFLVSNHIKANDRVGLLFDKPINHFIAALACLYHGCTQVPFHKTSTKSLLENYAKATRCQYLLSDLINRSDALFQFEFSIAKLKIPNFENSTKISKSTAGAEQIAILIIGSGTTGKNKIIPVTFSALELQITRDINIHSLQENERFLALSPISYYTSLRRMLASLQSHACAVFYDNNKNDLASFCNRLKIDHLSLVMTHAQYLFSIFSPQTTKKPRLPYLKSLFIGASPISQAMREFLQNEITPNVYIFYGPNEIGASTCAHLNNTGNIAGTIGLAVEGVQIEIVDDNDNLCAIGETGRMRLKAEGLCKHYEDDENNFISNESFKDGWFYPKDLAFIDSEGHIIFQGREDDLIIYYGNNIYPRQIEEVLEQHPMVKEAAAFGISLQNGEQIPLAVISIKDDLDTKDDLELAENDLIKKIKHFCDEKLHICSPAHIQIENELPKNAAGKILKRELKEKYQKIFIS